MRRWMERARVRVERKGEEGQGPGEAGEVGDVERRATEAGSRSPSPSGRPSCKSIRIIIL